MALSVRVRTLALRFRLVPALCLAACAPARAPLLPDASVYPTDEARAAFDAKLPADATHVSVPEWASLEEVWGTYDLPFMNALHGPKTVVFGDDDRMLVILGSRGEVRRWDRARHETVWRSDACRGGAPLPENVRPDEAQLYVSSRGGLAAVGFRSGYFCVLDQKTGKKVVDIPAHAMTTLGSNTFLARLVGTTLVTYAYRMPQWYPQGDGGSMNIEGAGGELRTWDARTGRRLSDVHIGGFFTAALSPDGTRFAVGDGDLRLFDIHGRILWTRKGGLYRLSFAANDRLLALRDTELVEVDAKDGTVRPFPPGYFPSWEMSPYKDAVSTRDGRYALTVLDGGRLILWDVAAHTEGAHGLLSPFERADHWAGSPTGSMFVAPGGVVVSSKTLAVIEQPRGHVRWVTLSGSGDRALSCRDAPPRAVEFWDASARTRGTWENPHEAFMQLTSDGTRVLVRESGRNVLREIATGRVLVDEPGHIWTAAALSPDGSRVAHLLWDDRRKASDVVFRDALTGAILWRNTREKPKHSILAFDASAERLVTFGDDRRVTLLSTHDGSVLARTGPVEAVHEIHLGDDFALVDDEKGLTVVDLATWTPRFRVVQEAYPRGIALPRNGAYFWEFDGALVRRRSLTTGEPLGDPIDLAPSDDEAHAIATSSDGKVLMVGTERGVLLRFRVTD